MSRRQYKRTQLVIYAFSCCPFIVFWGVETQTIGRHPIAKRSFIVRWILAIALRIWLPGNADKPDYNERRAGSEHNRIPWQLQYQQFIRPRNIDLHQTKRCGNSMRLRWPKEVQDMHPFGEELEYLSDLPKIPTQLNRRWTKISWSIVSKAALIWNRDPGYNVRSIHGAIFIRK